MGGVNVSLASPPITAVPLSAARPLYARPVGFLGLRLTWVVGLIGDDRVGWLDCEPSSKSSVTKC